MQLLFVWYLASLSLASILSMPIQSESDYFLAFSSIGNMRLLIGFAWFESGNVHSLRFSKREQDGIKSNGWREYDGQEYGFYRIHDDLNHISLAVMVIRQDNDVVFHVEGDSTREDGYPTDLNLLMVVYSNGTNSSFSVSNNDCLHTAKDWILVENGHSRYRILVDDDPQTTSPQYVFSRDFPFSLLSPHVSPNSCFERKAQYYGGILSSVNNTFLQLEKEMASLLENDKDELDSFAQLRVDQYKSSYAGNHDRDRLLERAAVPRIPTLPNELHANANFIIIQRVLETPFSTDFVFINESEQQTSDFSFFFNPSESELSLETQMRFRLLTGSELTERIKSRSNSFQSRFERCFRLKEKGFQKRTLVIAQQLFSNILASIHIQPSNSSFGMEWSLFQSCSSEFCNYTSPSCGFEQGFVVRLLLEWDVSLASSLLQSLIYSQADQMNPQACPPSFLFALDRLMQLQHEQEEKEDVELLSFLPLHQTVFDLLSPSLFIIQRYHRSSTSDDASLWSVYSIRTILLLLQFFGGEGEWVDTLKPLYFSARKRVTRDSPLAVALGIGSQNISQRIYDLTSDGVWDPSDPSLPPWLHYLLLRQLWKESTLNRELYTSIRTSFVQNVIGLIQQGKEVPLWASSIVLLAMGEIY